MSTTSRAVTPRGTATAASRPVTARITPLTIAPARLAKATIRTRPSPLRAATKPSSTSVQATGDETKEYYEVDLPKPLGVKFGRGTDGGAYISGIDGRRGSVTEDMQIGDKLVQVSASFGAEVWDALNFGQVMFAIRTRNGNVYLKLEKRNGDTSCFDFDEIDAVAAAMKRERAGGNYGYGTKETQSRNYASTKEREAARREMFDGALVKFKKGECEAALIDFEEVVGMEPRNYLGDDFSRVTNIYRVAQYNIACCYSALDQVDAGLEALESSMACGFEDYKKIRNDPNLANLRKSKKFLPVLEKYDEPIINREALEAIKGIFSFGKKDE